MRILQLLQKSQLRGAEIFASQLNRELNRIGHNSDLLIIFSGGKANEFVPEAERLNRPLKRRFYDFLGWKTLDQIIRHKKPDLIQANAADTLKFAAFSKLVFKWEPPIVFRNANKMGDFIDSYPKRKFNQFLINQCIGIASVSELCRLDFLETFNFEHDRTRTLPIGVNLDQNQYDLPHDLGELRGDGPLLVNVASLVREKNHEGLFRIFTEIKVEFPSAKLFIIGDGHLKEDLKEQISALNMQNDIHLLGYRKDVLSIVQNADLFLLPSLIEGLPGVILEAFMMNTTVVANDVGGISEVVIDKETGRLIPPADTSQFIEACLSLLNDPILSKTYAENANQLVIEHYLNPVIARKFEEFYKELI